jgi:hypothetical protein
MEFSHTTMKINKKQNTMVVKYAALKTVLPQVAA